MVARLLHGIYGNTSMYSQLVLPRENLRLWRVNFMFRGSYPKWSGVVEQWTAPCNLRKAEYSSCASYRKGILLRWFNIERMDNSNSRWELPCIIVLFFNVFVVVFFLSYLPHVCISKRSWHHKLTNFASSLFSFGGHIRINIIPSIMLNL